MESQRTPFVTRVVRVTRGSESLRVTIPQVVASSMGLHAGDQVTWSLDASSSVVKLRRLGEPRDGEPAAPTEPTAAEDSPANVQ